MRHSSTVQVVFDLCQSENRGPVVEYCKVVTWHLWSAPMIMCCSIIPCRRYLNKSPEDQDEDLPGLEEDIAPDFNLTVLRRRTMAAAAERRMQNQQDPAP